MKTVFSGIQPTSNLTIGNYLGAIKNWVGMQDKQKCIFCIVDSHAITVPQNPDELKQTSISNLALYIACGISAEKSTIFIQSSIPHHTELAWILGCNTPTGWLKRMTQFKDKAGKHQEKASLGLFAYPTLMAADILLYHTNIVPVGDDQVQHIELTRDIAGAFNRNYDVDYFTLPEAVINKSSARIMSLKDGKKKMSKSDANANSRIHLTDDNDTIANKIKRATTDSIVGIYADEENRPEVTNLLNIYCSFANKSMDDVVKTFEGKQTSYFKNQLTEVVTDALTPIRQEHQKLMQDTQYLQNVAEQGRKDAYEIASKTIKEVREIVGLFSGF